MLCDLTEKSTGLVKSYYVKYQNTEWKLGAFLTSTEVLISP